MQDPDGDDVARHRELWSIVNEQFTDIDATHRWAETGIRWGLFRLPEERVGLLGDVRDLDVLELGCGTAFLSAALTRAGARPIAVDLSPAQLTTARRCQREHGLSFPLIEATAEHVPLRSRTFDVVVSEYGSAPWSDPRAWLGEAARLLKPGGRLAFVTSSVISALCVPAEGGPAGERLLRGQPDVARVAWAGGGIEHHPSHGDWIRLLREAGFTVDALRELYAPEGAPPVEYYDIVTSAWATRWPADEAWLGHLSDE